MDDAYLIEEEPAGLSPDLRAELWLGGIVCGVVVLVGAMVVFVVKEGWPSFAHNGLSWFGAGGNPDTQISKMYNAGNTVGAKPYWTFHAWDLIWSTILSTAGAVILSFFFALFLAIFIVEFAPKRLANILEPVMRLLANVPSVVYGLIGLVVVVPFIANHLITQSESNAVTPVIHLNGQSLLAGVVVLTLMITPIMSAMFTEGLRSVPRTWIEASLALGVNRWRTFLKVAVRAARPALVAGTVLATARAIGEAVLLGMVTGGVAFPPNPADGFPLFLFEPTRGLAATILFNSDGVSVKSLKATLFAIAAVLLFSAMMLSLIGWGFKQPMKRYFNVGGVGA